VSAQEILTRLHAEPGPTFSPSLSTDTDRATAGGTIGSLARSGSPEPATETWLEGGERSIKDRPDQDEGWVPPTLFCGSCHSEIRVTVLFARKEDDVAPSQLHGDPDHIRLGAIAWCPVHGTHAPIRLPPVQSRRLTESTHATPGAAGTSSYINQEG
jgi:hypothetical protein